MATAKKEIVDEIVEDEVSNSEELGIESEMGADAETEEKIVNLNGKLYTQSIDSFGSTFLEPLF